MNSTIDSLSRADAVARASANTKPLWWAIGALSVAVLGMGGVLVKGQLTAPEPAPSTSSAAAAPAPVAEPVVAAKPEQVITEKAEPTPVRPAAQAAAKAPVKPKVVSQPAPATPTVTPSVASPSPAATVPAEPPVATAPVAVPTPPAVFQSQTKPLCINCGTVDSVTPVERGGHAVGVGAVAGGVLGAVVGNQIGQGSGRTVATILGALGGGMAGNTVEKNMKKTTQYEIRVRMEDGTLRTVEQATPLTAGTHVILDNGVLRAAPRVTTPVEQPTAVGQPASAKVYSTQ